MASEQEIAAAKAQLFAFFDSNGTIFSACEGVDNAASEERYLVSLGLPFELTSYVAPTMEDAWRLFGYSAERRRLDQFAKRERIREQFELESG